jgi:aminoglycoside 3-N-acetyltransferase
LLALGIQPGGVLQVHTSFSRVGAVDGGPDGLIAALRNALGKRGTLVMPSMSDDDDQPFDVNGTPCLGNGIVAERFRHLPGVLRSDSPHAFTAVGPRAAEITAPHPWHVPHGPASPVGRVPGMDGQVLLLGVGHDANTTIHLAEYLAGVRYRRAKHLTLMIDGLPSRREYREIDHCCQGFARMDEWLDAGRLQRRGRVGQGEARLMRAQDVVRVATLYLKDDETVFLHPPGVDHECDEARASIATAEEVGPC